MAAEGRGWVMGWECIVECTQQLRISQDVQKDLSCTTILCLATVYKFLTFFFLRPWSLESLFLVLLTRVGPPPPPPPSRSESLNCRLHNSTAVRLGEDKETGLRIGYSLPDLVFLNSLDLDPNSEAPYAAFCKKICKVVLAICQNFNNRKLKKSWCSSQEKKKYKKELF